MRKIIFAGVVGALMIPSVAVAAPQYHRTSIHHYAQQRAWHEGRRHHRNWVAYRAPLRNWRYRSVRVGYRLQPAFYGSRYYVSNYNAFRVGAPGLYHRWIRYGNDLLLVNVRTGRVLQVVPNRYW